jgi:hypothetical protein
MKFFLALSLLLSSAPLTINAFVVQHPQTARRLSLMRVATTSSDDTAGIDIDLGLTPELKRITEAFQRIPNEQLRYKQLLYMATNTEKTNNMPDTSKIPENKVPGCLSTVFVDGSAEFNKEIGDYTIDLIGDSDGLLTRGLVALLVR